MPDANEAYPPPPEPPLAPGHEPSQDADHDDVPNPPLPAPGPDVSGTPNYGLNDASSQANASAGGAEGASQPAEPAPGAAAGTGGDGHQQQQQQAYDINMQMHLAVAAAAAAASDPQHDASSGQPDAQAQNWGYAPGFEMLHSAGMVPYDASAAHVTTPKRAAGSTVPKRASLYNTGGNTNGRKPWQTDETAVLMNSLYEICLYKQEYVAMQPYAIVLRWHGPKGERSHLLASRNNMQLKDKCRNELLRIKRAEGTVPFIKRIIHPTLWNDDEENVTVEPNPPVPPVEDALQNGWQASDFSGNRSGDTQARARNPREGAAGRRSRRGRRSTEWDDTVDEAADANVQATVQPDEYVPIQQPQDPAQTALAQFVPSPPTTNGLDGQSKGKKRSKKRKQAEDSVAVADNDEACRQEIESQAATASAAAAHLHMQAQQAAAAYTNAVNQAQNLQGKRSESAQRKSNAKITNLHAAAHQTAQAAAQASMHAWQLHMQRFLPDTNQAQAAAQAAQAASSGQAPGMDMVQLQAQMQQYAAQAQAQQAQAVAEAPQGHKKRKHKHKSDQRDEPTAAANDGSLQSATEAANQALEALSSMPWNLGSLAPVGQQAPNEQGQVQNQEGQQDQSDQATT